MITQSVYTAFDPYPSYKGSSIHIDKVSQVLSQKFGKTLLITLEGQKEQRLGKRIEHKSFYSEEGNYLKRAQQYSSFVTAQLENEFHLRVGHFRDIWGGMPLLKLPFLTTVFEVNGLPSIELPNRYPLLPTETLKKIRDMEDYCLHQCNLIICPSETIKKHLIARSVLPEKIHVITNGADIPESYPKPIEIPDKYLVYFGALQPWQGVDTLIKAMKYLQDKPNIKLVICSSHKEKLSRPFFKLVNRLELNDQVVWKHKIGKQELFSILQHAICSIAPLTECERNLEQGCSPLKIFESMACKVPMVVSDLPVVREIVTENEAKFCRPERPAELARAIRLLIDYPEERKRLANNAYEKFENQFTWDRINNELSEFYDKLVTLAYA